MAKTIPKTILKAGLGGGYQHGIYQQLPMLYRGLALPKTSVGLPPHLLRHRQELEKGNARSKANPSYGWDLRSPPKGKSRHLLKEKCTSKCFLMPEREGFPVCTRYELTKPDCKYDCGGIITAYRRAKQYKYKQVSRDAKALARILKC